MVNIKDLTFDELKEKIENSEDSLEECNPGTEDYSLYSSELVEAKKELKHRKEKLHKQIVKDITAHDTMSKEEAGYLSYHGFLIDAALGTPGYEEVVSEDFEEDELERLWKESH